MNEAILSQEEWEEAFFATNPLMGDYNFFREEHEALLVELARVREQRDSLVLAVKELIGEGEVDAVFAALARIESLNTQKEMG